MLNSVSLVGKITDEGMKLSTARKMARLKAAGRYYATAGPSQFRDVPGPGRHGAAPAPGSRPGALPPESSTGEIP